MLPPSENGCTKLKITNRVVDDPQRLYFATPGLSHPPISLLLYLLLMEIGNQLP